MNWKLVRNPRKELLIQFFQVIVLLFIGTLPFIDNFAHVGGFLSGVLAGLVFLPSLSFGKWDRRRKLFIWLIAIPALGAWLFFLFYGFYNWDIAKGCTWCKYINCIPGMPWCRDKWQTYGDATVTASS